VRRRPRRERVILPDRGRTEEKDLQIQVAQPAGQRVEDEHASAQHLPPVPPVQSAAHRLFELRLVQGPPGRRRALASGLLAFYMDLNGPFLMAASGSCPAPNGKASHG
jgi:hypothetical protein